MYRAPFDCFPSRNPRENSKFDDVFQLARYWFVKWDDMRIYTRSDEGSGIRKILDSMGIHIPTRDIRDMLKRKINTEDICREEKYILYKICREFVDWEKVGPWRIIQEENGQGCVIRLDVMDWIASDEDHVFWILMKIVNGFDDFNPPRLHMWSFWACTCFVFLQNHQAAKRLYRKK